MDPVERLAAIEDIKQLKARYFRCLDTKDWDGFEAVFTPDAVMDMSGEMQDLENGGDGITRGAAKIAAFVRDSVHDLPTMHHGHMPEIEILTSTTARGIWAMEDRLGSLTGRSVHGFGHYRETYERVDGEWKITSTFLTRLDKTITRRRFG